MSANLLISDLAPNSAFYDKAYFTIFNVSEERTLSNLLKVNQDALRESKLEKEVVAFPDESIDNNNQPANTKSSQTFFFNSEVRLEGAPGRQTRGSSGGRKSSTGKDSNEFLLVGNFDIQKMKLEDLKLSQVSKQV